MQHSNVFLYQILKSADNPVKILATHVRTKRETAGGSGVGGGSKL